MMSSLVDAGSAPMIYPPIFFAVGFVGVILIGLAGSNKPRTDRASCSGLSRLWALLSLLVGLVFLAQRWGTWSNELMLCDAWAHAWCGLFLLAAIPLIVSMTADSEAPAALALGAVLGMAMLAYANHLFMLFLGLEIMSLSVYLLIVALGSGPARVEAAIKYFFSGAAASALYLFGLSVYYAKTGLLTLAVRPEASPGVEAAILLMLCAALFKVGAFPMHFWLPDAYEASAPELAGFMSTAVKAAGFLFLLRLAALLPGHSFPGPGFEAWLPWIAASTMTIGNLLALRQERVQRLLAYSSISHAGYLLAGVWAWLRLGAAPADAATLYLYLGVYLFMNTGAFIFLKLARVSTCDQLRGFCARAPGLAAFFALMLLSLAAIPPTGGFLAKLFVFWDVLRAGGVALAAAVALNSVVGLGYYFRLIKLMAFDEAAGEEALSVEPVSLGTRFILWACVVGTVLSGLLPGLRGALAGRLG